MRSAWLGELGAITRIVLLCIAVAVAYGVAHDQVTARVCIEYFTEFHPPVVASKSPTVQGMVWGVIATWWVGALLGFPLALAAHLGTWPRRAASELRRPLLNLMFSNAALALLVGIAGYLIAPHVFNIAPESLDAQRWPRFLAVWGAHNASYLAGSCGGIMLILFTLRGRRNEHRRLRREATPIAPESPSPR